MASSTWDFCQRIGAPRDQVKMGGATEGVERTGKEMGAGLGTRWASPEVPILFSLLSLSEGPTSFSDGASASVHALRLQRET